MKPLENRGKPKGALVSPYTQACVNHLRTHGPTTLEQLNAMIQHVGNWARDLQSIKTDSSTRLQRLLHNLCDGGHMHRVLRDDVMLWVHGPAPTPVAERSAPPVVPPPRIDLMRAPLYVPDAGPALRPGALNFKACASFGQRC